MAGITTEMLGNKVVTGEKLAVSAVDSAQLASNAVTGAKFGTGIFKVSLVAGEDESSTHQITCTGMAVGDEVVQVLVLTTAASIATMAVHAGIFTAAAAKITPGTEVNNTNNQYLIFWIDKT
jgi:hypothetical protein